MSARRVWSLLGWLLKRSHGLQTTGRKAPAGIGLFGLTASEDREADQRWLQGSGTDMRLGEDNEPESATSAGRAVIVELGKTRDPPAHIGGFGGHRAVGIERSQARELRSRGRCAHRAKSGVCRGFDGHSKATGFQRANVVDVAD